MPLAASHPGDRRVPFSSGATPGGVGRVCGDGRRQPLSLIGEIPAATRTVVRFRSKTRQLLTSCLCRFRAAFVAE
jgi:hypothetical protein